jgi:chromosome segregation ATPase
MSAEKQNDSFRLSFEDETTDEGDHQIQADIEALKIEKLSQRVTLITILIPILIVVILAVTYLDIKRRVISTETSGSKEFESLSQDLESRFSSVSVRQASLEDAFKKENDRLDEASAAMGVRIKEINEALKKLSGSAVTEKTLEKARSKTLTAVEDKLAPLSQELASTKDQLTAQGQDATARISELEGVLDTMDPALAKLRTDIQSVNEGLETVSKEKISKEQMDLALKLDRLRIVSDLQAEDKRLAQQLGELSRQITEVRGELADLENRLFPQKRGAIAPKPAAKSAAKPAAGKSAVSKPDAQEGISEQDLN